MVLSLGVGPVTAHASTPDIFHENFSYTEENIDFCGVNVDLVSSGVFTDKVFFDANGDLSRFMSSLSARTTLTADNGESVVIIAARNYVDPAPSIDEVAGTITFTSTLKGLPELIKSSRGAVLLRDAGVISFIDTFDINTFEFISSQPVIKGPHPEADSDFTAFCQVITAGLT